MGHRGSRLSPEFSLRCAAYTTTLPLEVFTQKNLVADCIRFLSHPFEVGVFRRGGVFERKFQPEEGVAHQPLLVSEN